MVCGGVLSVSDAQRAAFQRKMQTVASNMHSTNTNNTYRTGMNHYARFAIVWLGIVLAAGELLPSPSDSDLEMFVVFLAGSVQYRTSKVYLWGVRAWCLSAGYEFRPWASRYKVYRALQGVRRIWGDNEPQRKLAVTPKLLQAMLQFLALSSFNDCMLWAAMVVAFFGLFRKDNITTGKASAFNPRANLKVGDFLVKQSMLWVRVGHSKTIQYRQRCHWVPLVAMPGHPLCPVRAVVRVLHIHKSLGSSASTPMFLWSTGGQVKPMPHNQFVRGFKQLVGKCGQDWSRFSGHSFRRGGATFCFNLGVDPQFIKLLGDWKSDAYLLYDETTTARRLQLPRAMAHAIMRGVVDNGPRLEE